MMSVEELVERLRDGCNLQQRDGEIAADKLEELADALRVAQGNTDAAIEDYNEAKAALAEKDKEIAALKEACNQSRLAFSGMVSVQSAIDKLDARNAGGKDAE